MFHICFYMIPIQLVVFLCLGMLAVTMLAAKKAAPRKARARKKAKPPLKTGFEWFGVHENRTDGVYLKTGKASVVSGLILTPFLETYADQGGIHPIDYIMPPDRDGLKAQIEALSWPDRVGRFMHACGINLGATSLAAPGTQPGSGQTVAGKIIVAGSVVHIIGNVKAVKKLTKGLPIRP